METVLFIRGNNPRKGKKERRAKYNQNIDMHRLFFVENFFSFLELFLYKGTCNTDIGDFSIFFCHGTFWQMISYI